MENRIAELRKEKGLTLKQLGEILGVRDSTLSQYETGKRNPQLGFLQELSDFFGVSLEYLTKNSNERDYDVNDDEKALFVIQKLDSNEISYFDLSKNNLVDLAIWVISKTEEFNKGGKLNRYFDTANNFIRHVNNELDTMKWYTETRRQEHNNIEKIYEKLALDEDYYGAGHKQVLEFMEQSERIGYEATDKVLEYMKTLPDAPEEE
ncbi:helix-turn-helix transcriptional regulator [Lactococcus cremoris]|uniref:Helix-turn-helix transcriptional regulator n=1 Tax=Lactococcus lactis subsp. lactis TaxID=1360 RepID=A0AAJ4MME2_LACLL|nr:MULTISPECIES: helix-turn-helix transcriptional regulator [Lactococcus]QRZ35740.1 helix-turn-helix transcriptional regulator [Lactococcus lactis subsp. lactis]